MLLGTGFTGWMQPGLGLPTVQMRKILYPNHVHVA